MWDSFPEDIQNIIKLVSQEHHHWWHQHYHLNNKRAMDELTAGRRVPPHPRRHHGGRPGSLARVHEDDYVNNPVFKWLADAQLEWASQVVVARRILDTHYKDIRSKR